MWYYNNETGNFAVGSIPMKEVIVDDVVTFEEETGWVLIADRPMPHDDYIFDGMSWVAKVPNLHEIVNKFTLTTTAYIEGKVQAYNLANGLAFKDIDSFAKYAVNINSIHYSIANQFIEYADAVWTTVRQYQASATSIPSDAEFKALLDSVVF